MALPIAPIAATALRYGTVMAVAYYVAKRHKGLPKEPEEAAHENVDEGVSVRHHRTRNAAQANADARLKRVIRFGANGPGVEIDASALGRVRIRKL